MQYCFPVADIQSQLQIHWWLDIPDKIENIEIIFLIFITVYPALRFHNLEADNMHNVSSHPYLLYIFESVLVKRYADTKHCILPLLPPSCLNKTRYKFNRWWHHNTWSNTMHQSQRSRVQQLTIDMWKAGLNDVIMKISMNECVCVCRERRGSTKTTYTS